MPALLLHISQRNSIKRLEPLLEGPVKPDHDEGNKMRNDFQALNFPQYIDITLSILYYEADYF
jgi:hypothetical protein